MTNGSKNYTLPNCDVVVSVEYEINGDEINFISADIDGTELNCEMLGIHLDVTQSWELIRKTKYVSLKEWLQSKLDHDSQDIFCDHDIVVKSDHDEHFNQRSFV